MMRHHISGEKLMRFVDGMADAHETVEIQQHLHQCAQCRMQLEQTHLFFFDLEHLPEPVIDPNLLDETVRRWNIYRHSENKNDSIKPSRLIPFYKAATIGTIAAGLMFGVFLGGLTRITMLPDQEETRMTLAESVSDHSPINEPYLTLIMQTDQDLL